MFLKIRPVKPLLYFFFKAKSKDFLEYIDEHLSKNFEKKGANLYEIKGETLFKLNEILYLLKETFSSEIGEGPLPLILFIFEEEFSFSSSPVFRPGKIYFPSKIRNKILKALSGTKLFYKTITISSEVEELLFPATVDSNVLFNFKDALFVPLEKPCFFCQSYWHESEACPGLRIFEPFEKFKNLLHYSFVEIAKNLKGAYENQQLEESFWDYFYIRHFYLFPSFLKILFYFHEELDNWASLWKPLQIPLKGGELFLALEDLIYQRYKSAETKFKTLEGGDFRIHLGLMMISILESDFQKALYHLENGLTLTKNPLFSVIFIS